MASPYFSELTYVVTVNLKNGQSYRFNGAQLLPTTVPGTPLTSAQLQTAVTAMGVDVQAQMTTGLTGPSVVGSGVAIQQQSLAAQELNANPIVNTN